MAGPPTVLSEIDAFTEGRRGRLRPWRWIVLPVALAGAVMLFVPTVVATVPWAPILHWNCQRGPLVDARTYFAPGVVVNSPYHGYAWGNSSSPRLAYAATNGQAGGTFAPFQFQLYRMHNVTSGGPGPNHRCGVRYLATAVGLAADQATTVTFTTLSDGTTSDVGETAPAPIASLPDPLVGFAAAYKGSNSPAIDTCGSSAPTSVTTLSTRIFVAATFYVNGHPLTLPVVLQNIQRIHYLFPANGGIWSTDNLGAGPGATGGGLAFIYSGCPAANPLGRAP